MIPNDELNTLKPSADVKSVAESAPAEQEKMAVARAINLAANTGANSITWVNSLSKTLKTELEGLGYIVAPQTGAVVPPEGPVVWTISWK